MPKAGSFPNGTTPWVVAGPATGTLFNTGDVGNVVVNFTVVHTRVQTLTMDFIVTSSLDEGSELLKVTM